jgi:valyl-tRNA synthetase
MLAYKHRLTTELHEKQAYLRSLEDKLANANYVKNAPETIVQDTRNRRDETERLLTKLDDQLAALKQ